MSASKKQQLALFDFDGTLTRSDSLFVFLQFFRGNLYFIKKMLLSLPVLLRHKLGLISNSRAKEILLSNFLKGVAVAEFKSRCNSFGNEKIVSILSESVLNKFLKHVAQGDKVLIVSASVEDWILPWAQQWNVEVIATKLSIRDNVLTGKFDGLNCNYEEKVTRIKARLNLSDYNEIWAYGDSPGDEAMFGIATTVVFNGKVKK